MCKKEILIWDDKPSQANKLESAVIDSKTANKWEIEITTMKTKFEDFLPFLRKRHSEFDLLIMDCLEGGDKVIITALETLKNANLKVVAVSIDSKAMGDEFPRLGKLYNFCTPVLKYDFLDSDGDKSCENILASALNLKKSKKGLIDGIQLNLEPDIYLKHLVNIIGGEGILKLMIREGKKSHLIEALNDTIDIESLSQGFSGAIALKLQYLTEYNSKTTRFVKISGDLDKLKSELSKSHNEYLHFPSEYRLSYINSVPIKFNNYYFIIAELFENSLTLRSYIQEDKPSERLLPIIKEMMLYCFKPLYELACKPKIIKKKTLNILEIFNNDRLSYLKKSVKELGIIAGNQISIIAELKSILELYSTESKFYTAEDSHYVWVHGDLHGNNILINQKDIQSDVKDKIIIIDPANIEVAHWSRDICMLIVDIFAYGIDVGDEKYYGIVEIKKWKDMGLQILHNQLINNEGRNKGVVDTINWLTKIDNLESIFPKDVFSLWEFQLSLCVEFLRISYKQDQLPPGKRAACLLIGVEAFNIAERTFDPNKGKT